MKDFTFYNPVRIEFGGNKETRIGSYIEPFEVKKILIVYGSERIVKSGLLDKVIKSISNKQIEYVTLSGVKSNPVLSKVREGIELVKENKIDGVLGIGGGSVLDSVKAIAAGALYDGDVWDLFNGKLPQASLPIFNIMTLAATGSEMNPGAVVTNEETKEKFVMFAPCIYPKVSVINPELQNTVTAEYLAYSAVDVFAHCLDLYFSAQYIPNYNLRLVEAILKTVIETTNILLKEPNNTEARGEFAWAATMALNGNTSVGVKGHCYPSHMIEHSLSALYDIAHGAGLGICLPAWMRVVAETDKSRLNRFAYEVFGVKDAMSGIDLMAEWFKKIGSPITLAEGKIPESDIPMIVDHIYNTLKVSGLTQMISRETVEKTLEAAK